MSGTSEAAEHYLYQEGLRLASNYQTLIKQYLVHPSYKSQTAIRITRRPVPLQVSTTTTPLQENPYVFKPKSYSRNRNFRETISSSRLIPPPTKKYKHPPLESQTSKDHNFLDKKFINHQLQEETSSFFKQGFKQAQTNKEVARFGLPLKLNCPIQRQKNQLLSHKIQIVSTNNQKLSVSIHEGLLKANTNHSKQEQTLQGIVNPFNAKLKRQFSSKIEFVSDYKSGYTPIELQNRSKKEDEKDGGYEEIKKERTHDQNSKTHFIKKKQSTLSLTRTCGVSYIKPSESFQKPPFESLPPLIFQCSTSCTYSNELRAKFHHQIERLVTLSENRWLPAIMSTQEHMRDILLGKPCGKVIWVHGLKNLWPLFNEGSFLLVFFDQQFASTEQEVWSQFNTCYFKFGILAKRSTSGKKLFLKSIQAESLDKCETSSVNSFFTMGQNTNRSLPSLQDLRTEFRQLNEGEWAIERPFQEKKSEQPPLEERKQCKDICQDLAKELKNSRTVITMSLKFEMYVHEQLWKSLDHEGKNLLNAIVLTFEETLQKKSIEIIRDRFELANKQQREDILAKAMSKIKVGNTINNLSPVQRYVHSEAETFTLQKLLELNESLENRDPQMHQKGVITQVEIFKDKEGKENMALWQKSLKMPIYYISTRDSFAFDLVEKITQYQRQGRVYKKIQYSFEPDNLPDNFGDYKKLFPNLDTGVVCYHNFFSEEELQFFEAQTLQTELSAFKNKFLQMTVQPTIIGNRIKRTKFFFGYRYMWTRCQLAEPLSYVGAGVRRDVTPPPKWIKQIEDPLVEHGIVEPNFLNSVALNVYHDGTEGLAQHFDDAVRFRQPIYTLRLVSDGRLSFGSQFYGFCNGAFIIPLPRGCICVMNENSYAANGVKHCVRPCDMSGKSAAIIMRQMHHQVVREAAKYDELIDFPAWLSTLSEDPRGITYAEQKRRETEQILNQEEQRKEREKASKLISSTGL